MHQALYRKWRPQTFDDVCGQEHITSVLRYEAEHNAFSHAYLFCGSRGTGKTTCAKILAKVVNCEHPVNGSPCGVCAACQSIDSGAATDVLEMDAASNNGVDNIRDIRDEVVYSPSSLKYRVYIIDEVHMLSISAFNALLKTLEEPPEHVVFILATTELHKLPATIISRCQRIDFRRISIDALVARLEHIAQAEGIALDPAAARMLARLAQGGMRDAISLLELCAGVDRKVTPETVENSVGLTGRGALLDTVNAVAACDYDVLFEQIASVVRSSKDIAVFWQDLISLWRDMMILKTTRRAATYLDLTDHEMAQMKEITQKFSKETLLYHCRLMEDALLAMQQSNAVKRVLAEMTLIRMCDASLDTSAEAMLSRIAQLEEQMVTGRMFAPAKATDSQEPKAQQSVPVVEKAEKSVSAAPSVMVSGTEKRILRPMRNWMEAAQRMAVSAPMLASFVRGARAYTTENGQLIVRFNNTFALGMMEKDDARDRLRVAVATVLRREIADRDLIYEVEGQTENKSVIDEIIEAAEEP